LVNWNQIATQYDPDCYNLYTRNSEWGTFIGCQSIEIFDVRTPNVSKLFSDNLSLQSCNTILGVKGRRNYVKTGEHFWFIDRDVNNANVWYVPKGYYSDGVSTPDFLREILPGGVLDTESPKTLSAALFHDRYFCLYSYTTKAWNSDREGYPTRLLSEVNEGRLLPTAYRRKGCANASFRNGLRASGASSFISTVFRGMVGIVNPGKSGYCPKKIHANALIDLEEKFETMLGYGPIGTGGRAQLPGCRTKEPILLCLGEIEALWYLISWRAEEYAVGVNSSESSGLLSDEWRQVLTRIMCYDLQAHFNEDNWPENYTFTPEQAQEVCAFVDIESLRYSNEDLRDQISDFHQIYQDPNIVIESPFRAGDFFIEGALMLNGEDGPQTFLQTVSSMPSIDYAILSIVAWNENREGSEDVQ